MKLPVLQIREVHRKRHDPKDGNTPDPQRYEIRVRLLERTAVEERALSLFAAVAVMVVVSNNTMGSVSSSPSTARGVLCPAMSLVESGMIRVCRSTD